MKLYYEWGTRQINKHGEELCGDSIAVSRHAESVTLALSDGLGSGVKANILATLTTQIAMHMLENELSLDEVVQTLTETLPVDRVRKLAYSTFVIAQFFRHGNARVVEFDTPPTIFLRNRKTRKIDYEERNVKDKTIHESVLSLEAGDWVVFVSDGVLNAGIGGVYPLGWGWEQASRFLEGHAHRDLSAEDLAEKIVEAVGENVEDGFAQPVRGGADRLRAGPGKRAPAQRAADNAHGLPARLARPLAGTFCGTSAGAFACWAGGRRAGRFQRRDRPIKGGQVVG